ncbi:MAG: S9 family peptidase [Woeseiaceae bacterium]
MIKTIIKPVAALLLVATSALAIADEYFTNIDIFELEQAVDPQISPNGSRVAYIRRSMDIMTDRAASNIWVVDAAGKDHRPLLAGPADYGNQRWSPSGDRLAFVAETEGRGAQIQLLWMDSGQTATLSNVRNKPSSITWSPDGTQIAFEMFVDVTVEPLATPPEKPEGAEWAPPVKLIETIRYRGDGEGYLDTGNSQLFVLSAEGGTPRQLTFGEFDHGGPLAWSKDGKHIFFAANRKDEWQYDPLEAELWSVDVSTGGLEKLTDRDGPDFAPAVSPDGTKIAYLGFDDKKMGYHNVGVYILDTKDGSVRALTDGFDRSIEDVQWAGSSNRLYIQYDDYGRKHVATLSMTGKIDVVVSDVGGISLGRPYTSGGFSVADKGAFAYSYGRSDRPADVGVGRAGSGSVKRLTQLNEDLLGHKKLGNVQEMTWQSSADDLEIQGWLVTPPDFDPSKKYPLVLEIHGGPFATYGPHFAAEIQLFAAAGYVVLYSNPRGSTSYGYDFANEIHHNYPGQDYDDLMSGVDAVIAKGFVNPEQLFVTGGSGGGVLSAWIVGKTDRFAAAVVAKPVINWVSTVLTTDIATFMPAYWFSDPPWVDPQPYWDRSPLSLVGNVTTPTALLTGEQDHRTPITESEQYYQALKLRKIDTALIRVPEASHGIAARPSHLIAKVDNILGWFARYAE